MRRILISLLTCLWAVACGGSSRVVEPVPVQEQPTARPLSLVETAKEALLRAKRAKSPEAARDLLAAAEQSLFDALRAVDELSSEERDELAFLNRQHVHLLVLLHVDHDRSEGRSLSEAAIAVATRKVFDQAVRVAKNGQPSAEHLAQQIASHVPKRGVILEFFGLNAQIAFDAGRTMVKPLYQRWAIFGFHENGNIFSLVLNTDEGTTTERVNTLIERIRLKKDTSQAAHELDALASVVLGSTERGSHVVVAPDGALTALPFEALLSSTSRPLIEERQISYLESTAELLFTTPTANPSHDPSPSILVIDPAYGSNAQAATAAPATAAPTTAAPATAAAPGDPWGGGDTFTRNPYSAVEREAFLSGVDNVLILEGAEASKPNLLAIHHPPILHLATHGKFVDTRAARMHPGDQLRPGAMPSYLVLGLAGANQSPVESGRVSASELASLDLHGTRLVVVSACESGVGHSFPGHGMLALRHSLSQAGSQAQVVTLWQVNAEAMSRLMESFYRRLSVGPAEALRLAKLDLRRDPRFADPDYWAGVVLWGDWQAFEMPQCDTQSEPTCKGRRKNRLSLSNAELGSFNATCKVEVTQADNTARLHVVTVGTVSGCLPPPRSKAKVDFREMFGPNRVEAVYTPFRWDPRGIATIEYTAQLPSPPAPGRYYLDVELPCGENEPVYGTGTCIVTPP